LGTTLELRISPLHSENRSDPVYSRPVAHSLGAFFTGR
jgi:hypothetical protein